jgi:hypothetical protein
MMRKRPNIIGIGCFAGSATLRRVLRKSLERLILCRYEDINPLAEQMISDGDLTRFFSRVIALGTKKPDHFDRALESIPLSAQITGFYLGCHKQALHLAVFFLNGGFQQTHFIARLENFTRLRNRRLH